MRIFLFVSLFLAFCAGQAHAMSRCAHLGEQMSSASQVFAGVAVKEAGRELSEENQKLLDKARADFLKETIEDMTEDDYFDPQETVDLWIGIPTVTRFEVIKTYKGQHKDMVDVHHQSGSIFGAIFEIGKTYLITADIGDGFDPDVFSAGRCDYSLITGELADFERSHQVVQE